MPSRATGVVLFALALLPALAVVPEAPPTPPPFQNLQVLHEDIPRQELIDTMKGFTRALGVRCNHCHVGEGDDLSNYDFTSDAKHEKQAARVMIEMVQAINRDFLPRVEHEHHDHEQGNAEKAEAHGHAEGHEAGHAEGHVAGEAHEVARVTCMTCHRGEPEPRIDQEPSAPAPPEDAEARPPDASRTPERLEPPPPPAGA